MGLINESNKFGSNKQLYENCSFSCRDSTCCMFKLVGDCYNCEKVSCENCTNWDSRVGCLLSDADSELKKFYTELIIEQNEQK